MRRMLLSCLFSTVLATIIALPISAAAVNDVLKADTSPLIDGKEEAVWEKAVEYKLDNYIVAIHDHEKLDPKKNADDFSGTWRALWDETNFYLYINITDPKRISWMKQNDRKEIHFDDNALFYLTPNAGHKYITAMWHIGSKEMSGWYGPPMWNSYDLSKIKYEVNDYGSGYIVEAAIPWSLVGMEPKEGATALLDIQATDNDIGGDSNASDGINGRYPQSKLTWSDLKNEAWTDNSNLGTIVLRSKPTQTSASNAKLSLVINGNYVTDEAEPILAEETAFVPMRLIFEALGAHVEWDQASETATAIKDGTQISLRVGSVEAAINDVAVVLDVAPRLINGKTMVPLRFVSEALGAQVQWKEETRTIIINAAAD